MLFIQPNLDKNHIQNLTDLLEEIDTAIYKIAQVLLDNIRFGFNKKVDYDSWDDLVTYKSILTDIMYCADFMCNVNVNTVVSKIKTLINKQNISC